MALSGLPTRRDPGVTPRSDSRQDAVLTGHALAPNEYVAQDGTLTALTQLRDSGDTLAAQHPDHTFHPLSSVLRHWQANGADVRMFHQGMSALRPRYAALGLRDLLPLDRVMVGSASQRPDAFGGFHHPDQGYRHLQMRALITMHGDMAGDMPTVPALAVLDLLRAYAHDCLHYGSCRRYLLRAGKVVRTQYGINYRQPTGRTYSAPDVPGSPSTRNIGTVMEGACDREARSITRQVAAMRGIEYHDGVNGFAYRDVTGQLDDRDRPTGLAPETAKYVASMLKYEANVNARYLGFLDEIGQSEGDGLHDTILSAMISGNLTELCAWLDARHGPGTFTALFMSPRYLSAPDGEFTLAS